MMTTISITGKETKVHIREALKAVFPGVKFGLTSSFDSVNVSWTDGPLVPDVQRVLNRFESYTYVCDRTDYKKPTGYEWKGVMYLGARYLNTSRALSGERKALIDQYLAEHVGLTYIDANIPQRLTAEKALIESGELPGSPPADRPDLMLDERPMLDMRKPKAPAAPVDVPNNVVQLFPKNGKQLLKDFTPEQRLKLAVLQQIFQVDELKHCTPTMVDQLFSFAANELYNTGKG